MSLADYAYEKLAAGVHVLATHPGRVRERLIAAFHTSLVQVPRGTLSDEPREIWGNVWDRVTAIKGTEKSGSLEPSINALDEDEAVKVAEMIMTVEAMVDASVHDHSLKRAP